METAHKFDTAGNLMGIANVPASARVGKPCFIFINGGFLHRVGPYRLYTEAARKLEELGFYVLRFDLSGLGDSASEGSGKLFAEQAQADIAVAIEFMRTQYQCEVFCTAGLCSGGDDALEAALHDKSISGVLLLDGDGYRTGKFYLHRILFHYQHRLLNVKKWGRIMNRIIQLVTNQKKMSVPVPDAQEDLRLLKSDGELLSAVSELAKRGTRLHFIFTGGVFKYYNYAGQLFDMFKSIDLHDKVTESFFKECDHMFLLQKSRTAIIDDLLLWADNTYTQERIQSPTEVEARQAA